MGQHNDELAHLSVKKPVQVKKGGEKEGGKRYQRKKKIPHREEKPGKPEKEKEGQLHVITKYRKHGPQERGVLP